MLPDLTAIHDFQYCVMRNGLIDDGYIREAFTWCNNRRGQHIIWERLDRALYNREFHERYPSTTVTHLVRTTSDHSPLLLKLERDASNASDGFIFQRTWADHPDFLNLFTVNWARPISGSP